MSYPTPIENSLAIKNYRKEWSGLVHTLTNVPFINPVTENLNDPAVFNTRFQQLAQSIRHAFNASADIAIRDKKYLEAFLTGYTNPLAAISHTLHDIRTITNAPAYNINGSPITFPEPRAMYNVSTLGSFSTSAMYAWVFVDGIKIQESNYDIMNTAYGVKCFIKSNNVQLEGKRVDIVINRILNPEKKYHETKVTASRNSRTILIPVDALGVFYHVDYLKVYFRNDANNLYRAINDSLVTKEIDVVGSTVKLIIDGKADINTAGTIVVCNSVHYHNQTITIRSASQWNREVIIKEVVNRKDYPVPFLTSNDFDIFLDGWKLEPGVDYAVLDNESSSGLPVIRFNFTPNSNYSAPKILEIFKNEAVTNEANLTFTLDEVDDRGIAVRFNQLDSIPFMGKLGNCFIANKYIPNAWINVLQRNILQIDPTKLKAKRNLFYQTRIVYTLDMKEIIALSRRHLSEFDQVMNLFDREKLIDSFTEETDTNVINGRIGVDEALADRLLGQSNEITRDYSKGASDTDTLTNILDNREKTSRFVLNSNGLLSDHLEIANSFIGRLVIDTNITTLEREIINLNHSFTHGYSRPMGN